MSDADPFDFAALVSRLPATTGRREALRLARMLLDHAFGEKGFMSFTDYSDRSFSVGEWDDEQRAVVAAVAACDAAWPEVGYFLQESLELEFEPTQAELRAALAAPPGATVREREEPSGGGVPGENEVVAAVRRLMECFTAGQRRLEEELKRFERYRPYSSAAVPMLVEQLRAGKLKQRSAAAWALGRIGPAARSAVPALMDALLRDWKNEYVPFALSDIGLDDFGPLLALTESDDPDAASRAADVLTSLETVPAEVVERLLGGSNSELRRIAVVKLRFGAAAANLPRLFQLLDDEDEEVAAQARYGLHDAGPACVPAILGAVEGSSTARRRLLAQVMADFGKHLLPHAGPVAGWLLREADAEVRIDLLRSLAKWESAPPEVVAALSRVAATDERVVVRQQALQTIGHLKSEGLVPLVISLAEGDADARVRASAVGTLRSFREPRNTIMAALDRAMASPSTAVALQAVWALYARGAAGVAVLLAHLNQPRDKRVKAETAWALGLLQAGPALESLRSLKGEGGGLTASLAGWAVESCE